MTAEALISELAQRVMGWGVAPDRYLIGNRSWIPRWRFQPLDRLEDAFRLLEKAQPEHYNMGLDGSGCFSVEVRIAGKLGVARDELKPRAITLAIARALGLEGVDGEDAARVSAHSLPRSCAPCARCRAWWCASGTGAPRASPAIRTFTVATTAGTSSWRSKDPVRNRPRFSWRG
jgi:hypothetical protein